MCVGHHPCPFLPQDERDLKLARQVSTLEREREIETECVHIARYNSHQDFPIVLYGGPRRYITSGLPSGRKGRHARS